VEALRRGSAEAFQLLGISQDTEAVGCFCGIAILQEWEGAFQECPQAAITLRTLGLEQSALGW